MKRLIIIAVLALASPALAQQPDPAFLQQALIAMQQQRNAALDGQAQSQAMAAVEIAKLKARIAELEKAPAAKPSE
jgi:hypothetical protein